MNTEPSDPARLHDSWGTKCGSGERFHTLTVPTNTWLVVRLEGHGFSRLTEAHFEKPFDPRMHELMVTVASDVMEEFHGSLGFTVSDEIVIAFSPTWMELDRNVEQTVSLTAALASASFTQVCGLPALFKSRIWVAPGEGDAGLESVKDYFQGRQADGARGALNAACYWMLRHGGMTPTDATRHLERMDHEEKLEWLGQRGVRLEHQATWTRHGAGLWWEPLANDDADSQAPPHTTTRHLTIERELPFGAAFGEWIRGRLTR